VAGADLGLEAADPEWAATASVAQLGLFAGSGSGFEVVEDAFEADGSVRQGLLQIGPPAARACGFCHGVVDSGMDPITLARRTPDDRMTEFGGVVFSGRRISDAAINIAGRDGLVRPWDVHAERLLDCNHCHFAPNHPAHAAPRAGSAPRHLRDDVRRPGVGEFLLRPDHRLANSGPGEGRGCTSCHEARAVHGFLPRIDRHLEKLACEACHVPALYAPARQEADYSMLERPGVPRLTYRGTAGAPTDPRAYVTGYRPVLLPRREDGVTKLAPHNLVTTWRWVSAAGQPVPTDRLDAAFFVGGRHHPDLVRALDRNGDRRLEGPELILDSADRVASARSRLEAVGVKAPRIVGSIESRSIHHGIAPGSSATRDCAACHDRASRLSEPLRLSDRAPFGATLAASGLSGEVMGAVADRIDFVPRSDRAGLYVLGHSRLGAIDRIGLLAVLAVLGAVLTHGILRWRAARRSAPGSEVAS
jgi:hypothetical protein